MKQLHPRAFWLFFTRSLLITIFVVFGFFAWALFLTRFELFFPILPLAVGIGLVLAFIWAWLSYHFYRYELSTDGFKKELGVIYKRYVTIPYDRIQNVDIYRSLLHRILGLSSLYIQTAGMSYSGKYSGRQSTAEGQLPGLSIKEAERVRDELVKRVKGPSKQGL